MTGCDALHLEILTRISSQFQNFGSQIFKNGRCIDSSSSSYTMTVLDRVLEETMDTTDRKLQTGLGRSRLRGLFGGRRFAALATFTAFASFSGLLDKSRMGIVRKMIGEFHLSKSKPSRPKLLVVVVAVAVTSMRNENLVVKVAFIQG